MQGPKIDKVIFWVALIVITCFSVPLVSFRPMARPCWARHWSWSTKTLGWAYLWFTIGAFRILIYYALGRYGNVRFGGPDAKPEVLCPAGGDAVLRRHRRQRHVLGHHRSGPTTIPARPSGSSPSPRKRPNGRPCTACSTGASPPGRSTASRRCRWPTSTGTASGRSCGSPPPAGRHRRQGGRRHAWQDHRRAFHVRPDRWRRHLDRTGHADALGGPGELFGLERSFSLDVVVILIWGAIFGFSVYSGLEKGIKVLSDINLWLIVFILAFTFLFGPTIFIIDTFTNSIGLLVQNFIEMSFYVDPITKADNFIAAAGEGSPTSIPAAPSRNGGPSSTGPGGSPTRPSWASSWRVSPRAARSAS